MIIPIWFFQHPEQATPLGWLVRGATKTTMVIIIPLSILLRPTFTSLHPWLSPVTCPEPRDAEDLKRAVAWITFCELPIKGLCFPCIHSEFMAHKNKNLSNPIYMAPKQHTSVSVSYLPGFLSKIANLF